MEACCSTIPELRLWQAMNDVGERVNEHVCYSRNEAPQSGTSGQKSAELVLKSSLLQALQETIHGNVFTLQIT